eukprot:CAMPEP_0172377950 /NCGR_PEP_ID=MMETSP1060-20121228/69170_1 /TAXON_ID=37318 /ORGANISM="Pseudo-nitzschia pungens, Strain cf. cingulata" /LENGTH=536 /DNA_ID=CAMNT_0013105661 /DNA_START=101 /DNA_END=1711 /DNA_ORIENTATION=-
MTRPRSNSNGTRNSIGSSSSHSTALNSPPDSPANHKTLKSASSSLSTSTHSSFSTCTATTISTTTTTTSSSDDSSKWIERDPDQKPSQQPQKCDTVMFGGHELFIVTNVEPLWDPVPDSQLVVRADIIMPWHPSHSSQRYSHRRKSVIQFVSKTTRRRKDKRSASKTNHSKVSSLYGRNPCNTATRKSNRRYSSSWRQASRQKLNQIALRAMTLLVLALMVALYLDNDDSDQPLPYYQYAVDNMFSNPPSQPSGRKTRRSRSPKSSENSIPEFLSLEDTTNPSTDDHHQQILGIESNGGVYHNKEKLVMVSGDEGALSRYDFWNEKTLVAFRRMMSRAQNVGTTIRTIANTQKQFVLAVDGEERPPETDTGSVTVEILLCNKPLLVRGGDANTIFFFDDKKNQRKSTESTAGSTRAVRKDFRKSARKKHTMAGTPIFEDDVAGDVTHTIRSDYRKRTERTAEAQNNEQQSDVDADRRKRGVCIVAQLRPHNGTFAITPVKSSSRHFDPGPRPQRTAGSPYETQPYVPPQHLGANLL